MAELFSSADREGWLSADPVANPGPTASSTRRKALSAAFARRVARIEDLIAELGVRQADGVQRLVIDRAVLELETRLDRCQADVDRLRASSPAHEVWFYTVDQPDRDVAWVMLEAERALADEAHEWRLVLN